MSVRKAAPVGGVGITKQYINKQGVPTISCNCSKKWKKSHAREKVRNTAAQAHADREHGGMFFDLSF